MNRCDPAVPTRALLCRGARHAAVLLLMTLAGGCRAPGPDASPTLGAAPPALDDATVVLFDGRDWSGWQSRSGEASGWQVAADGSVIAGGGDAVTERTFGDFQLHIEFMCPVMAEAEGQARSNSGVYLHGRYEVQVLDTFGQAPYLGSCGAVYSIAPPLLEASRPPGEFQTYDVVFRAPRFDETGAVVELPRVTVLQNGVMIHDNLELPRVTPGGLDDRMVPSGPLLLQDHGDPVRYRNIWIRPLTLPAAD